MVTLWYNENDAHEYWREEGAEMNLLENIRNLMHTMHLTSTEAMNALLVPPEKQKELESML